MGLIERLPSVIEESRNIYTATEEAEFITDSVIGNQNGNYNDSNLMAVGDNMAFMKELKENGGFQSGIQLIYIDPPFFSSTNYGSEIKISNDLIKDLPTIKQFAYHDSWKEGMDEYLIMLCSRFYMMRDLLKEDGCIAVHLDWHVVHYVKVLMDEIFGEKNFVNEIIWQYKSGGSSKKHYARKHDTILLYAKNKKYYFKPQKEKSYNRGYKPYRFKGVKEYRDETGWYTMVNMKDVWQIDMVGRTSKERTGYATQKPEALLMRLLESTTKEGDVVADFFGGSGTLCAAAEKMGRRWIYCDIGNLAAASAKKRLADNGASFRSVKQTDIPESGCYFDIETILTDSVTDDKVLTIRLTDYKINKYSSVPVDEKHKADLLKAVRKDPLRFIDFWTVDFYFDGKIHKVDKMMSRQKEYMPVETSIIAKDVKHISIKIQDIFGNTAEKILSI